MLNTEEDTTYDVDLTKRIVGFFVDHYDEVWVPPTELRKEVEERVRWKVASIQAAYSGFFETESSKRPCGILWLVMASGMRPCGILQLVMACGKRPSSRLWLVTDSGKRPCGIPLLIPTSRNGAQKWIGK